MSGQTFVRDRSSIKRRNISNLTSLCRMCASRCEKPILIYSPEGVDNELALKIQNYLPIKVSESDTLPLQLCYDCTNILIEWDAVVLGSIAAGKKLRAIQWQEQQLHLNAEKKEDSIKKSEENKRHRVSNTEESLCCSVCNEGGMDFRQLVNHLKSHDSDNSRPKEKNEAENSARTDGHKSDLESPASRILHLNKEGSKTFQHNQEDNIFQPVVCLEPLKMELRSKRRAGRKKSETSEAKTDHDGGENMKGRLRGKRSKCSSDSEVKASSGNIEGGSGDPLVTSSTNSPTFKPAANCSTHESDKERNDLKEDSSSESQNPTFRPKVRIISAESINHNLEQRAKANQSSKILESLKLSELQQRTVSVLRRNVSDQPDSTPLPSKAKIVVSSGVIKEIKLDNSRPGPKYLRLPDGRIIRLLPSTQRQSLNASCSQNVKAKSSQSLLIPSKIPNIPVGPTQDKCDQSNTNGLHTTAAEGSEASKTRHETDKLNNIEALGIPRDQQGPGADCKKLDTSILSDNAGSTSSATPGPKLLTTCQNILLPGPLREEMMTKGRRLITFKLQPGPKYGAARYTCAFCGVRNLLHQSLQEHAQLHSPHKVQMEVR